MPVPQSGGWNRTKNLAFLLLLPIPALFIIAPVLSALYILAFVAIFLSLGFLANKRQSRFNCVTCGLCCSLTVKPSEKDIKRIEKSGHKREEFLEKGTLKKIQGYCLFLKKEDMTAKSKLNMQSNFVCSIYNSRPDICRKWPFQSKAVYWKWFLVCPSLRTLIGGRSSPRPGPRLVYRPGSRTKEQ